MRAKFSHGIIIEEETKNPKYFIDLEAIRREKSFSVKALAKCYRISEEEAARILNFDFDDPRTPTRPFLMDFFRGKETSSQVISKLAKMIKAFSDWEDQVISSEGLRIIGEASDVDEDDLKTALIEQGCQVEIYPDEDDSTAVEKEPATLEHSLWEIEGGYAIFNLLDSFIPDLEGIKSKRYSNVWGNFIKFLRELESQNKSEGVELVLSEIRSAAERNPITHLKIENEFQKLYTLSASVTRDYFLDVIDSIMNEFSYLRFIAPDNFRIALNFGVNPSDRDSLTEYDDVLNELAASGVSTKRLQPFLRSLSSITAITFFSILTPLHVEIYERLKRHGLTAPQFTDFVLESNPTTADYFKEIMMNPKANQVALVLLQELGTEGISSELNEKIEIFIYHSSGDVLLRDYIRFIRNGDRCRANITLALARDLVMGQDLKAARVKLPLLENPDEIQTNSLVLQQIVKAKISCSTTQDTEKQVWYDRAYASIPEIENYQNLKSELRGIWRMHNEEGLRLIIEFLELVKDAPGFSAILDSFGFVSSQVLSRAENEIKIIHDLAWESEKSLKYYISRASSPVVQLPDYMLAEIPEAHELISQANELNRVVFIDFNISNSQMEFLRLNFPSIEFVNLHAISDSRLRKLLTDETLVICDTSYNPVTLTQIKKSVSMSNGNMGFYNEKTLDSLIFSLRNRTPKEAKVPEDVNPYKKVYEVSRSAEFDDWLSKQSLETRKSFERRISNIENGILGLIKPLVSAKNVSMLRELRVFAPTGSYRLFIHLNGNKIILLSTYKKGDTIQSQNAAIQKAEGIAYQML